MRQIHIANSSGRDATVLYDRAKSQPGPTLGLPQAEVTFRRYLVSVPELTHEALAEGISEDYGQALIEGDPEIDRERVGRFITDSSRIYLSASGEVMHAVPRMLEVITNPDGSEKERREPQDTPANANVELPLTFSRTRMDISDAARRFVFTTTIELHHSDGLTYDFLFGVAKELAEASQLALVGAGKGAKQPIVLQENGAPYRGFLEGQVEGEKYKLLLHLSRMELKRPAAAASAQDDSSSASDDDQENDGPKNTDGGGPRKEDGDVAKKVANKTESDGPKNTDDGSKKAKRGRRKQ